MKDWHLVIVVLGVTAVGITLLVARSALLPTQPKRIKDSENSEGRTVRKMITVSFEDRDDSTSCFLVFNTFFLSFVYCYPSV